MTGKLVYQELLAELRKGKKAGLLTFLKIDESGRGKIEKKMVLKMEDTGIPGMDAAFFQKIKESMEIGMPVFAQCEGRHVFMEPYYPEPRLVILGGGHIALPLAEFAAKVGFSVTVVDDRLTYANKQRFPFAKEVLCTAFENCFEKLDPTPADFVVIITRGHKHDGVCLKQALQYDLAYLGMIGSRRKVRQMMEDLAAEGYPQEKLEKVHSPIGLDIGAVTPEEIAVSILAEVIQCRRKGMVAPQKYCESRPFKWSEFEHYVLEEIAKSADEPKALVTITATKGSVPRKTGAKMIVWPDGRTVGSIGGGCSESKILHLAREVALQGDGGCLLESIDLTGEMADSVEMVCGGKMDVLIEAFS